jgi:hypothetical protein
MLQNNRQTSCTRFRRFGTLASLLPTRLPSDKAEIVDLHKAGEKGVQSQMERLDLALEFRIALYHFVRYILKVLGSH